MSSNWLQAQRWEKLWHNDCINSYTEETKQIVYARKMGLVGTTELGKYPVYNLEKKNIVDIGGGGYSVLLKGINLGECYVVDPLNYPDWIKMRYSCKKITFLRQKGEDIKSEDFPKFFDECWIYNCLQHCEDPKKIIDNARQISKIIRIFEWLETGTNEGHINNLHEAEMNEWLGGVGKTEVLNESGCYGLAYFGIFLGEHYNDI